MVKDKLSTAFRLFRDGGVKNLYEYSRNRLRVRAGAHKEEVRFDRCIFSLKEIEDEPTRVELITKNYEASERRAIARYLPRGLPVIELGGSMGVVACITNKLLKDPTAHVVVEANPLVIPHMEHNRKLNGCRFKIVNRAVAYGAESVTFRPSTNMAGSSITRPGEQPPVTVGTISLGQLVADYQFPTFSLVCDIEGLEDDLVCNEAEVLRNANTVIMETHARYVGEDKLKQMMTKLEEVGLKIVEEIGFVVVLQR